MDKNDLSAFAREMGRVGGKAGTGASKRRPKAFYRRIAKLAAEQRALNQKGKGNEPLDIRAAGERAK